MKWRLEAWNPDYALPQVGFEESQFAPEVDTEIEPEWAPLNTRECEWPLLYFVDGRQRIDAVIANEHGKRALLVTVAAGALVRDDGGIRLAGSPWIRRYALHTGGFGAQIRVGESFVYEPIETSAKDLRDLSGKVNGVMRGLEAQLAGTLEGGVVVVDGPLYQGENPILRPMLGYAKTMWQRYLPAEKEAILMLLEDKCRTPVFKIHKSERRKLDLYSWYLRLPINPSAPFHAGAGLIRMETHAAADREAIDLADQMAYLFCHMASSPSRDPRAPQNLIPVGGLEAWLGRYMGQGEVIRRRIVQELFAS